MARPRQWHGAARAAPSWLLALLLVTVGVCAGNLCDPCEPERCPPAREDCAWGLAPDPCDCCMTCGRGLDDSCGGQYGLLGRCGEGLQCAIRPGPGDLITGHEAGVCQPRGVFCGNVTCDAEFERPYNWDSLEGSGEEGPPPVICPADSVLLPPVETKYGCCQRQQGCTCRPVETCEWLQCDSGLYLQVTAPATGNPGFCCDQMECVNETSLQCFYKNEVYSAEETWQPDRCSMCTCHAGLVFCSAIVCEMPTGCSWVGIPEGECCTVCRGCVLEDGGRHPLDVSWEQDECTTCQCVGGRAHCQTASCDIKCAHPKKVPGSCCPVCDGEASVTLPPHCPLLGNCSLMCPHGMETDAFGCYLCSCRQSLCGLECPGGYVYDGNMNQLCQCAQKVKPRCPPLNNCRKDCMYGFRVNRDGCKRCRCNKCPKFSCKKKCPHGYKESQRGCRLCKCRAEDDVSSTRVPSLHGHTCMAVDGWHREDGQSWYDGCRRCFCYEGHEMCAMITCPMPHCRSPVIKRGDCCPTCAHDSTGLSPGLTTRCSGEDGLPHVEGELWTLDECTRCICHDGGVLCEIETCAPLLCHRPVKLPSACCLVCPEGTSLAPLSVVSGRKACVGEGGTKIAEGDSWRMNACQSCVCHAGQIHCYSQTCPLLSCNRTIVKKGQCCPICIHYSVFKDL